MASVNMIDVLLLRLRCPSMFDSITFINFLSLLQQEFSEDHKINCSKNGNNKTHIIDKPNIIRTRSRFMTVETNVKSS